MKISQLFYSLQGEGVYSGVPAFFFRFPGCNLNCGEGGGWVCDSIAQWTKFTEMTKEQVWEQMKTEVELDDENLANALRSGAVHVVFTGGEPFLTSNLVYISEVVSLLREKMVAIFTAEIETNGTLNVVDKLDSVFPSGIRLQINCSPKLSSAGMTKERRINIEALVSLVEYTKRRYGANMTFKFVTASHDDVLEALDLLRDLATTSVKSLPALRAMTMLMPAGESREKIVTESPKVWEWCSMYQLTFSSRLHIIAFDKRIDV